MAYFRPNKGCKWCKAVKADPKLMKRIYRSSYFTGQKNAESLREIAMTVRLPYHSIRNHVKVHQTLTDDELNSNKVEEIARATSNKLIQKNIQATAARQDVLDTLSAEMKNVDLSQLKAKDLFELVLKAAKHADDVKAKQKDQQQDWLKHMNAIRSGSQQQPAPIEGEVTEVKHLPFDPWKEDLKS